MRTLLCAACAALALASCGDDDPQQRFVPVEAGYKGCLTVDQTDGTFFSQQDVEVEYEIETDANTMSICMYRVRFAEAMPIELDMTIPGVEYILTGDGKISISGDGIVPLALGGEFPQYTITSLSGRIADGKLEMTMMCGIYPLSYTGTAAQ